jgi:hypothetical protein
MNAERIEDHLADTGPWHDGTCEQCGAPMRWRTTNLGTVARTGDERLAGREVESLHMGPGLANLKQKATRAVDEWDLYMRAVARVQDPLGIYHMRFVAAIGQLRDVLATWDTLSTTRPAGELSTLPARTGTEAHAPATDSALPGARYRVTDAYGQEWTAGPGAPEPHLDPERWDGLS